MLIIEQLNKLNETIERENKFDTSFEPILINILPHNW